MGALSGLRVIDISQVMAGPFCGMLLADMGADVIKVEAPGGDSTRNQGKRGEPFAAVNRNKRGISINLKEPAGRDVLRRLASNADVLIENYRPGVMEGFGLGYDSLSQINPRLIYASISGFGQTGPYAQRGGFDLIAQGMSGLMSVTGEPGGPPVKVGVPITDLSAGLFTAYGILSALYDRERTGLGQRLDGSLLEAGVALMVWESTSYWSSGEVPGPLGSAHRNSAPYQAYRTADGFMNIGAQNEKLWILLCTGVLKRPDLLEVPEFQGVRNRHSNNPRLTEVLEAEFTQHPNEYWLPLMEENGIPAGPILNLEQVLGDPHIQHREMVKEVEHPTLGRLKGLGHPVKLSRTPASIYRPGPLLGEHGREVLAEVGYADEEIAALITSGVITITTPWEVT